MTDTPELPPLPEPLPAMEWQHHMFTADQLRAYAAEAVRVARQPLTAQRLDALIQEHVGGSELADGEYSAMVMFAAAVERALGITKDHT